MIGTYHTTQSNLNNTNNKHIHSQKQTNDFADPADFALFADFTSEIKA